MEEDSRRRQVALLIEKKHLVELLGLYIHRSGGSSDDQPGPNTYT
jgi:hypothetical protein